jgi:hypothetical protein
MKQTTEHRTPTRLQAHFIFSQLTMPLQKKIKRACKPKHNDSSDITAILTQQTYGRKEERTDNTGLAKVAVQCSADTFVVNQTLVLRINICGENRHLRQARNRYGQVRQT